MNRQKIMANRRRDIIIIVGCTILALIGGYGWSRGFGNFTWFRNFDTPGTASVDDVTVMPAPIKSTKVYPNSETDYSGSTFDAKNSTSVTLTVSVTSDESAGLTYTWYRSINDEWRSLTNPYITQGLTEKYTGADSQTLSITELPAGQTFSYKVQIATGDGYKCYSEPFTVTRHQHSWTYTEAARPSRPSAASAPPAAAA